MWCYQSHTQHWSKLSGRTPGSRREQETCSDSQAVWHSGTLCLTAVEGACLVEDAVPSFPDRAQNGPVVVDGLGEEGKHSLAAEVESLGIVAAVAAGTFDLAAGIVLAHSDLGKREAVDALHRATAGIGS